MRKRRCCADTPAGTQAAAPSRQGGQACRAAFPGLDPGDSKASQTPCFRAGIRHRPAPPDPLEGSARDGDLISK